MGQESSFRRVRRTGPETGTALGGYAAHPGPIATWLPRVRSVAKQKAQVAGRLRCATQDGQRGATVVVTAAVARGFEALKVEKCHVLTPPSNQLVGMETRTTGEVRGTGGTWAPNAVPIPGPARRRPIRWPDPSTGEGAADRGTRGHLRRASRASRVRTPGRRPSTAAHRVRLR